MTFNKRMCSTLALPIVIVISGCSSPKTDSWMDKITTIGESTKADFQKFKDDGGLNVHNAWRGYSVESISSEYTEEKLSFLQVTLKKNHADSNGVDPTINNLKASFAAECGNDWREVGENGYTNSDSHPISCEVSRNSADFIGGLVMSKSKE